MTTNGLNIGANAMTGKQVIPITFKRNFSLTKQVAFKTRKYENYVKYTNIYEEHPRSGRSDLQRLMNRGRKLRPYNKLFPVTGKNTGLGVEGGSELAEKLAAKHRVPAVGFIGKGGVFKHVPEMQTEFIVPDLSDFELQPYVPYDKVANITKGQHTARELFDAIYADRIKKKFYAKGTDQEQIDPKSFLKGMLTQSDKTNKK